MTVPTLMLADRCRIHSDKMDEEGWHVTATVLRHAAEELDRLLALLNEAMQLPAAPDDPDTGWTPHSSWLARVRAALIKGCQPDTVLMRLETAERERDAAEAVVADMFGRLNSTDRHKFGVVREDSKAMLARHAARIRTADHT